ncbi:hypothetical protein HPP92_010064 [Vanilla planifolia]|uniref:Uncharacterized protein n=1 Tax=Vanilla planifolia TaxID=51239 RepID=A0A835RDH0_VANPL|nr:hypothetical protein HPP92_010064 [Vanilla planifolia]
MRYAFIKFDLHASAYKYVQFDITQPAKQGRNQGERGRANPSFAVLFLRRWVKLSLTLSRALITRRNGRFPSIPREREEETFSLVVFVGRRKGREMVDNRKGVFTVPAVCGRQVEVLSRDGSHYSITSGVLPALRARGGRRVKLRPFILSPYDKRYRYGF